MPGGFDEAQAGLDEGKHLPARALEAVTTTIWRSTMREHSGAAEGKNNNRNPTLRDAEREKGRSGEALHDAKRKEHEPSRSSTIRP